ncbi:hypothetical protein [Diatraea saccharalis granulovirus]|uniref:Chitin-binding type-2 domain-containing protein n=1 Tax=Diatraea saccharalis granulovirus TaxID=1675862 RepID=A0A0R7EYW1_9BBAC|nr:hypothetical protein [Diatraea saccharalis granulovirus]AKN80770.1 hypothetical protein [Diatraea saccharalis granulovirus]
MDLFNFSTLIFVLFIILKIIIYHNVKNIQTRDWLMKRICINGYYGNVADPFECDSYYKCPEGLKFYCDIGNEFNGDKGCCEAITSTGCYNVLSRRLLD